MMLRGAGRAGGQKATDLARRDNRYAQPASCLQATDQPNVNANGVPVALSLWPFTCGLQVSFILLIVDAGTPAKLFASR
jgi:hypothetical protein